MSQDSLHLETERAFLFDMGGREGLSYQLASTRGGHQNSVLLLYIGKCAGEDSFSCT
jgi:hypothetical protein